MMPGVMGCIAGDDTVLVITRGAQVAADVARHLLALADPSARACPLPTALDIPSHLGAAAAASSRREE